MKKKRSNWPYLQKDKGGNLVLYPATFFFPVKGYIIPDEKIRKEFINMNIPACVLGAIMFIHAREYGIFYHVAATVFYFLIMCIIHYIFFKKYPLSKRKYSWVEHFDGVNRKNSKSRLWKYMIVWFLASILFIKYFIISSDIHSIYDGVFGVVVFGSLSILTLLAIIHRGK